MDGTTEFDYIQSKFPPDFLFVVSSYEGLTEMLLSEKCNVITIFLSELAAIVASNDEIVDRNFIVGKKRLINDPLAAVTRNDEWEFSDIINWVVQALYYGEEQGLTMLNC